MLRAQQKEPFNLLLELFATSSSDHLLTACIYLTVKELSRFNSVSSQFRKLVTTSRIFDQLIKRDMLTLYHTLEVPCLFGVNTEISLRPTKKIIKATKIQITFADKILAPFLLAIDESVLQHILNPTIISSHFRNFMEKYPKMTFGHSSELYRFIICLVCELNLLTPSLIKKLIAYKRSYDRLLDPNHQNEPSVLTIHDRNLDCPLFALIRSNNWTRELILSLSNDAKIDFNFKSPIWGKKTFANAIAARHQLTSDVIKTFKEIGVDLVDMPLTLARSGYLTAELLSTFINLNINFTQIDNMGNGVHHLCSRSKTLTRELAEILKKHGSDMKSKNSQNEDIVSLAKEIGGLSYTPDDTHTALCQTLMNETSTNDIADCKSHNPRSPF